MFFYDSTIILIIPVLILAFWAQSKVKGNYQKFSRVPIASGLSGKEIAERILKGNGIDHVEVVKHEGTLSDHYNPSTKRVHLSEGVYHGRSIASASIAAHEVGHALQHAGGYYPIVLRGNLLPVASFGSKAAFPLFILGFLFSAPALMDLGIIFFAAALLFHVVTLPVEYNASGRAVNQLSEAMILNPEEMVGARSMLNSAALTYVASTLMALANLLRLLLIRGRR